MQFLDRGVYRVTSKYFIERRTNVLEMIEFHYIVCYPKHVNNISERVHGRVVSIWSYLIYT